MKSPEGLKPVLRIAVRAAESALLVLSGYLPSVLLHPNSVESASFISAGPSITAPLSEKLASNYRYGYENVPPIPAKYDIASSVTSDSETVSEEEPQIVSIDYTPGHGQQSFPWAVEDPRIEGLEATGLNPGGVYDKYDTLDIWLYGSNSKAAQRQMYTRDFLTAVYAEDVARGGADWTGDCRGSASASYFSPIIEGDITITVAGKGSVTFTEKERRLLATKRYSGLALDPDYRDLSSYDTFAEMSIRVKNEEPVTANFSPSPHQEWWGLVTDIDDATGLVTMTIFTTWNQTGKQVIIRPYSSLSAMAVLHSDRAETGFEGNRQLFNKDTVGLVTGTHQLVG